MNAIREIEIREINFWKMGFWDMGFRKIKFGILVGTYKVEFILFIIVPYIPRKSSLFPLARDALLCLEFQFLQFFSKKTGIYKKCEER